MRLLSAFLDHLPALTSIGDYVLAAEPTGEAQIERARQRLTLGLRESHKLLQPEARHELEAQFEDFHKRYRDFYIAAHETQVGAPAHRDLIESFYASPEWRQFKLLAQLNLDGRAFEQDAQALVSLIQETRCELPIAELLQRQPHCCCSFRLNRRLHLGSLLDALKALTTAALTYYCHALWRRRDSLGAAVRARGEEPIARATEDFLAACGDGRLDGLTPEMVSALNQCLPEPAIPLALPALPRLDGASYTKEELRQRLTEWLESLPEHDGLRFRVERA
jgi:hypothetical protein